jgi:hypothetical protein
MATQFDNTVEESKKQVGSPHVIAAAVRRALGKTQKNKLGTTLGKWKRD